MLVTDMSMRLQRLMRYSRHITCSVVYLRVVFQKPDAACTQLSKTEFLSDWGRHKDFKVNSAANISLGASIIVSTVSAGSSPSLRYYFSINRLRILFDGDVYARVPTDTRPLIGTTLQWALFVNKRDSGTDPLSVINNCTFHRVLADVNYPTILKEMTRTQR